MSQNQLQGAVLPVGGPDALLLLPAPEADQQLRAPRVPGRRRHRLPRLLPPLRREDALRPVVDARGRGREENGREVGFNFHAAEAAYRGLLLLAVRQTVQVAVSRRRPMVI